MEFSYIHGKICVEILNFEIWPHIYLFYFIYSYFSSKIYKGLPFIKVYKGLPCILLKAETLHYKIYMSDEKQNKTYVTVFFKRDKGNPDGI